MIVNKANQNRVGGGLPNPTSLRELRPATAGKYLSQLCAKKEKG